MTKHGVFAILSPVAARATAAVLENDIVKRQKRKNSQISERDNGIGSQLALTEEEVKD